MKNELILIFTAALMFGCSTPPAVDVDISKVCAADNEKKYISTSGFLDDRGSIFCSNIGGGPVRCGLDVVAELAGGKVFSADIEQGNGADEIEKLPSGYKKEDIRIHDDKDAVIALGDKVKLTGQMSITPDGSVCFMTVDKIER